MEVINNQTVITPTPIIENKKINNETSKMNPLWIILPIVLLVLGGALFWLWINKPIDYKNILGGNSNNLTLEDTLKFINKDSLELANANDTITKEFESEKKDIIPPGQKDDFANISTKELKSEKESTKSSDSDNLFSDNNLSNRKSKRNKTETNFDGSNLSSSKSSTLNPAKEEENYKALLQQKERWSTIKNDLQNTLNSGNNAAAEKLKNSERVLERIDKKLQESGKILGKN